jgi:hypothetical protein
MKITNIDNDGLIFDNGATISHYHSQDCCEHVYADWASLKDQSLEDVEFNDFIIEKVAGSGFRIVAANKNAYFVPCYNEQNGYYSSALELIIGFKGNTKQVDISDCVEDHID